MMQFDGHAIGIQQGQETLFSDFEDGGQMWSGSGPRISRKAVIFAQPYLSVPAVQLSLSMWDMDSKTNARGDIRAEDITESGFVATFRTWSDTRVARARVVWLAIGQTYHLDQWDDV